MNTYRFSISNGIFEHRAKIGSAIWVFLWLIDKTTKEVPSSMNSNTVDGLVLNGRPVMMSEIGRDLQMSSHGVRYQILELQAGGYVRAISHGPGKANGYAVMNSKKFSHRLNGVSSDPTRKLSGTPPENCQGASSDPTRKLSGTPPENCQGPHPKTVIANKEDNTLHTTTTTESLSGSLFGPQFLTPEQALAREENESLLKVWAHYLEATGKHTKMYEFSDERRTRGLLRLRECAQKVNGDYGKAAQMMCAAIDALVASNWHTGNNPRGKRYLDWDKHLFNTYQQMEGWWNE